MICSPARSRASPKTLLGSEAVPSQQVGRSGNGISLDRSAGSDEALHCRLGRQADHAESAAWVAGGERPQDD
eukprot:12220146-Alexandrium_andersonii.AAC.1